MKPVFIVNWSTQFSQRNNGTLLIGLHDKFKHIDMSRRDLYHAWEEEASLWRKEN